MEKTKAVFILGATGAGKSKIAVKLAKKFNGEIISADSVQVFKEFDINSAKITSKEMDGVKHYNIDLVSPKEEFSTFDFCEITKKEIKEISQKGKIPFIVGGTGLYVKALTNGYNLGGTEKHEDFRKKIEKKIEESGLESVYKELKDLAPQIALSIDEKNPARVIRGYEIAVFGQEKTKKDVDFDFLLLAMDIPREKLYERINKRVDEIVKNGGVEEAKTLYQKYGLVQPFRAIGYKEFIPYFDGKDSLENCINLVKQHTRNYAKRQLTFLRGIKDVRFLDIQNYQNAEKEAEEIIEKFLKEGVN